MAQWDGRPFRVPDEYYSGWAIWYGPGGVEGDCATEAETTGYDFTVSEYQFVSEEDQFLKTSTHVTSDELEAAQVARGQRMPRNDQEWLRLAAGYGVAKLAYWGGEEDWVYSLPA
jgi:hypothetical protein